METVIYALVFILGSGIGSFLNVVSLRYDPEKYIWKNIGGRSHCMNCKKTLSWYELVPIFSFIFQKGKCRSCSHVLSFQYPLVEALTAFSFLAVALKFDIAGKVLFNQPLPFFEVVAVFVWWVVFCSFIVLSLVDLKHMIIPDEINILLAVSGLLLSAIQSVQYAFGASVSFLKHYAYLFGFIPNIWANRLVASLVVAGFFIFIIAVTKGRAMGWGDVKLGAASGLIFGWPDSILIIVFSFIAGAIWSTPLLLKKKENHEGLYSFRTFYCCRFGSRLLFRI